MKKIAGDLSSMPGRHAIKALLNMLKMSSLKKSSSEDTKDALDTLYAAMRLRRPKAYGMCWVSPRAR